MGAVPATLDNSFSSTDSPLLIVAMYIAAAADPVGDHPLAAAVSLLAFIIFIVLSLIASFNPAPNRSEACSARGQQVQALFPSSSRGKNFLSLFSSKAFLIRLQSLSKLYTL